MFLVIIQTSEACCSCNEKAKDYHDAEDRLEKPSAKTSNIYY